MFTLSRKSVLKVVSVIGTLVIALAVTMTAFASHGSWYVDSVSCSPGVITVCGFADDTDDVEVDVFVNGSFLVDLGNEPEGELSNDFTGNMCYSYGNPAFGQGDTVFVENESNGTDASTVCGAAGTCGDDGRINTNCAAPVITYCDGETLKIYQLDAAGEGSLLFTYKLADVPTSGNSDKLLKQVGKVKLYWRHEDGLLKLLAPQTDGKIYYMLLDPTTCTSQREGAEWGLK